MLDDTDFTPDVISFDEPVKVKPDPYAAQPEPGILAETAKIKRIVDNASSLNDFDVALRMLALLVKKHKLHNASEINPYIVEMEAYILARRPD